MGGVATSKLPALARIATDINLAMILPIWLNNRSHSGWANAGTVIFFWFLVRKGFNIQNPLLAFQGSSLIDQQEADYIYNSILPLTIMFTLGVFAFVLRVFDMREFIPLGATWPSFVNMVGAPDESKIKGLEAATIKVYDEAEKKDTLSRWGFINVLLYKNSSPSSIMWHTLVGILLFLVSAIVPELLFMFLDESKKRVTMGVGFVLKLVSHIVGWLYYTKYTNLSVWGPTKYNTDELIRQQTNNNKRGSRLTVDPETNKAIYARTEATIRKNSLVLGSVDLLSYILGKSLIVIPDVPDFDIVWISLVVLVSGVAFVLVVTIIILINQKRKQSRSPQKGGKEESDEPRNDNDDDEEEEDEEEDEEDEEEEEKQKPGKKSASTKMSQFEVNSPLSALRKIGKNL